MFFGLINFFRYHVEDKLPSCTLYLYSHNLKSRYVSSSVSKISFRRFVASAILDKGYQNYHNDGTQQNPATTNISFNTTVFFDDKSVAVRISRVIQEIIKRG